ncbi:4Fe-4S binding protein [bacterium]|nr:4Fe-4S binding protein [bacterium]MBU2600027.1 4Fe-4S binding protein [bacterium]
MSTLPKWHELPVGGLILEAGSARDYKTGGWRSIKPIYNQEKCINCLNCWIHCPDSSIMVKESKVTGIDYDYCKGCGICAKVCPPKVAAISMIEEGR